MPFYLVLFNVESTRNLVLSALVWIGLQLLTLAICACVMCIMKARREDLLASCFYAKHNLILIAVLSALFLFMQTYLAIALSLLWYFFAHRLFKADCNLLFLWSYPTKQSPKDRRKNEAVIALAKQVQTDLPPKYGARELFRIYREQMTIASTLPSSICDTVGTGWSHFFTFPFLRITALSGLFSAIKALLPLFSAQGYWIDRASGAPLVYLTANAILCLTVIIGGAICGLELGDLCLPSSSFHKTQLTVLLIFLYVLVVVLLLNGIFSWFVL